MKNKKERYIMIVKKEGKQSSGVIELELGEQIRERLREKKK